MASALLQVSEQPAGSSSLAPHQASDSQPQAPQGVPQLNRLPSLPQRKSRAPKPEVASSSEAGGQEGAAGSVMPKSQAGSADAQGPQIEGDSKESAAAASVANSQAGRHESSANAQGPELEGDSKKPAAADSAATARAGSDELSAEPQGPELEGDSMADAAAAPKPDVDMDTSATDMVHVL